MRLFIFLLKYLLTYFPFKHILTVEWNEKYALKYKKQKSLTQFWAIVPIIHRQYLYCYTKKNIINSELWLQICQKCLDANKSLGFRNSN